MNINRDYLIINDVKKSNVKLDNGSIFFYITDKNTQNIFVNLVINVSNNDLIQKYANIENAEDYTLTMNIVKPSNTFKVIEGKLHDKEKAIFEFNLSEDCCDEIGTYKCELLTKCTINDHEEITTSNKLTYKVKSSVLNDLDDIVEAPEYPLVIQLFDKLSDIEQYEEDRRANELARQLAEQQRQTRFDALDADMTDSIQAMDDKVVDVENRITAKEQAVDKLINDTKADIDDYKVAKDQEIDDYKAAKDTEINEAITAQDNKIDEAISNQNDRIALVENNDTTQNNRLDTLENRATQHESRLTDVEAKNTEQDGRLDIVENKNAQQDNRLTTAEAKNVEQDNRLNAIEAIDVAQNTRLDAIEIKNQQQDDRLLDVEKVNKRQDMNLKCLFAESKNNMIDVTEEGNSIYLQNSTVGYTLIDEIQGNTMVNCNKEPDKELILNGNINTQGYSNVTLTEGVDGGKVDVALEGNTMVNVCDQKDPVAITKSYTVETGNHVALQGEYDGKCRPVVAGNTLWIDNDTEEVLTAFDESKNLRLQSTFEDNLVTQEMVDNGEEVADNLGKYRVDYVVTGKNKLNLPSAFNEWDGAKIYANGNTVKFTPNAYSSMGMTYTTVFTPMNIKQGSKLIFSAQKMTDASWTSGTMAMGLYMHYKDGTQVQFNTPDFTGRASINTVKSIIFTVEQDVVDIGLYGIGYAVQGASGECVYNVQLEYATEEQTEPTTYEPYKEYTKTLYLNSPLLEGDTIEQQGDNVVHVHRYGSYIFDTETDRSDGTDLGNTIRLGVNITNSVSCSAGKSTSISTLPFLYSYNTDTEHQYVSNNWIQVFVNKNKLSNNKLINPITVAYQLASPQYEVISQNDTILCDSYVNGHLDVDSVVPIEKVDFLHFEKDLTYLYANTQYTVQFVSDNAITVDITLGGTKLLAQSIVVGLNKITITTPETLIDNKLIIDGTGANISEVVVTEATDQDFGYFEGMKSVGECEDLQVISSNSDNTLSTTQTLTHEPLRAVGDIKDKYILIDGKWYIERNCGSVIITDLFTVKKDGDLLFVDVKQSIQNNTCYSDKLPRLNIREIIDGKTGICSQYRSTNNSRIYINILNITTENALQLWLVENPVTVVYQLVEPVYEPIDYNPFTVYSDITHISNNSTIPCNMTIKNTGYNCLLKPSTTYTVSSNLGLNVVTTPTTLTEDCLRFYDTDTSDVTTMKNVTILEGDYTTNGKPLPSHFSGIESAFEQEYDEEKGKYKVKIRVQNEDASKENYIEFYVNEPLRGIGDVKDKVYVKDDKVVVQRNCGQRGYQDGDFGTYLTDKVNTVYQLAEPVYEEVEYNDVKLFIESFKNSTLFYNSNVPVTSTVHYSYSVPIVDTVAQTADISNQQDSMIIDLATQVAVMEMMLM